MPSWTALRYILVALFGVLLNIHHYAFAAPIPETWESISSAAVVPVQARLDHTQPTTAATDLFHPGQASFARSLLPCQDHRQDGAPTLEVSMWTPQQEDRPHMCFLPLGIRSSAAELAMVPDFLAPLGSATTSEATESQQCKIHQFESNRSFQSVLSHGCFRPYRWSSSLCRQPQAEKRQIKEVQSSSTQSPQGIQALGHRRHRWLQAFPGASLVLQFAQIAICAGFHSNPCDIVISGRAAPNFDWAAAQVSGSTHSGNTGVSYVLDGEGQSFHGEVPPQLCDQAREGPERPDRSSRRKAAAPQQMEKLCYRRSGKMDPVNRGIQEGRPDPRGTDSGSKRCPHRHQGTVRPDAIADGHGWRYIHRDFGRGGEQNGCSIRENLRWFAADDGLFEQSQGDGRSDGGGAAKSVQAAASGRSCIRRSVFYGARQGEALGSACQGRQLGTSEAVVAYWSHSICDEPTFKSLWAARLEGLQAAFDLGLPSTAPLVRTPQCCGKRSGPRKVSFSNTIRLQFCAADSLLSASMDISVEAFSTWTEKPWSLHRLSISSFTTLQPSPHGDSFSQGRDEEVLYGDDEGSFVQAHAIKRLRNEFQQPDWPGFDQQDVHDAGDPDDGSTAHSTSSDNEHDSQRSTSPERVTESAPHRDGVVRTVLLYWRDNPAIHAQISSLDVEGQLAEIAEHLGFDRHDLVQVYRVNVELKYIPAHITPLLVHHLTDFVPGEAVCLCLVDVEIHGNRHEHHYATFPAVDRRVVVMPQRLTRRLILELSLTLYYCQRVQHRCIVKVNDKLIPLQDEQFFWASHGDYVLISVPPDEECDDTTSHLMEEALRDARRSMLDSPLATPQDGYSPSLVPSEEIRQEYGQAADDATSLMQTASPLPLPLMDISAKILNTNDVDLPLDTEACISTGRDFALYDQSASTLPPSKRLSWTEEFLRAMGALQTAQEDMPEFPAEQNVPLADLPSWIQELWPIWQQFARPGPGAVEYMARVETWYTDHSRVQHCLSSRIVILGADPTSWVTDILAAWRDLVLPGHDIQIVAVLPMTDDQAPNICAQLLLIQRPDPFLRSIIVTISDTAVQRGLPQSCAVVAGDHVRLHSVLLMTNMLYHCPPEVLTNRCRLYYGTRELRGEAYIPAVHGDVFNLIIQRDVTVDIHTLIGLPDPHLRQRLAALLEQGIHYLHVQDGERPDLPAVLAPDWFSQLEQAFDTHAAPEHLEEGPVFYIHTWYLDAETTSRCPVSRPVRLLQDRRTWRGSLIAVWQDQIHTHQSIDFAVVDPTPPRLPWMSPTAHILLTQRADPIHASVLVSAISHQGEDPLMMQAMYYLPNRVSGADVIEAHFAQDLRGPCRVRRGAHVFPAIQAVQIGNGDSLEIDLPPSTTISTPEADDAVNMLQTHAQVVQKKTHPVTLSLDAVIPPMVDKDLSKVNHPELLFSEEEDWPQRLQEMSLSFGPLPEALDMRASTLHALQDPGSYIEPSFAGKLALYVDGSARGHGAAWSVIAVEYDWYGSPTLLGALSGRVEINGSSPQWIGALHADNVAAELTASVAAHLVALVMGRSAFTVIRPDLKLSAMLSTSSWSCGSHCELVALAHWLGTWFTQEGGSCNEVRGHTAHPWNDLADCCPTCPC